MEPIDDCTTHAAVTNLRPDLFKAVHAGVPCVDIRRLDAEWGDILEEKPAFAYARSYSPHDNIETRNYPAMLVTISLYDSRVPYWMPAKYIAKLRSLKTDSNQLVLKCNMGAGHSGASGRYDQLKETAFEYAWLMSQVGIKK